MSSSSRLGGGNPFAEGEPRVSRPAAAVIVIFGATGDLTQRKLIPALYNLARDQFLPEQFLVVGAARTPLSDEQFRSRLEEGVRQYSRRELEPQVWERFAQNIFYQSVDGTKPESFQALKERVAALGRERGESFNYIYYLSVAPEVFGDIAGNLRQAGLVEGATDGAFQSTRLIVEKPFGRDLASARELNGILRGAFPEPQIYRIDHYLGKETVQNILVFRFANGIFEPLWNRRYIDQIQITFAEELGVGSRAAYFDQSGLTRDVVQNHLLQVLALLCIEPPTSISSADSIRDEKVKVLKALRRFSEDELRNQVVRAQYAQGWIEGGQVSAYREEPGVPWDSETDTFTAMQLAIDNWRWEGVPIYIRAGKRLPKRITEISIFFKKPPVAIFRGLAVESLDANVLAIQVQPEEGISLRIGSKPPGLRTRVRPVTMNFEYGESFGTPSPEAYERLLLDAIKGDATLFARDDEIEEAWDFLDPVLESWPATDVPLYFYPAGTWGPVAAEQLLARQGRKWRPL